MVGRNIFDTEGCILTGKWEGMEMQGSYLKMHEDKSYGFWMDLALRFCRREYNRSEYSRNSEWIVEYKMFRGIKYLLRAYMVTHFSFGEIEVEDNEL